MKHLLLPLLLALSLCACRTDSSSVDKAGRTLAATAATADNVMKGWAAWVVTHNVDPVKESDVKTAYQNYQIYMGLAKAAYAEFAISGDQAALDKSLEDLSNARYKLTSTISLLQK